MTADSDHDTFLKITASYKSANTYITKISQPLTWVQVLQNCNKRANTLAH